MTTYENFESTAIRFVKVSENLVTIRWRGNIDKDYTYITSKPKEFQQKLLKTIANSESVGKYINKTIKEGLITENK